MEGAVNLDDQVSILRRAPDLADLDALSRAGFGTVVNLRAAGEGEQVLSPEEEAEEAKERGLSYLSCPVTPADLDSRTASMISKELQKLPAPVIVHCASGRRAALIALSHWARLHDADAREVADRAQAAGLNISEADLEPLIAG